MPDSDQRSGRAGFLWSPGDVVTRNEFNGAAKQLREEVRGLKEELHTKGSTASLEAQISSVTESMGRLTRRQQRTSHDLNVVRHQRDLLEKMVFNGVNLLVAAVLAIAGGGLYFRITDEEKLSKYQTGLTSDVNRAEANLASFQKKIDAKIRSLDANLSLLLPVTEGVVRKQFEQLILILPRITISAIDYQVRQQLQDYATGLYWLRVQKSEEFKAQLYLFASVQDCLAQYTSLLDSPPDAFALDQIERECDRILRSAGGGTDERFKSQMTDFLAAFRCFAGVVPLKRFMECRHERKREYLDAARAHFDTITANPPLDSDITARAWSSLAVIEIESALFGTRQTNSSASRPVVDSPTRPEAAQAALKYLQKAVVNCKDESLRITIENNEAVAHLELAVDAMERRIWKTARNEIMKALGKCPQGMYKRPAIFMTRAEIRCVQIYMEQQQHACQPSEARAAAVEIINLAREARELGYRRYEGMTEAEFVAEEPYLKYMRELDCHVKRSQPWRTLLQTLGVILDDDMQSRES